MPGKLYNDLNSYLKDKFGQKVYKVSLDPGLSCPNLDGTLSRNGCTFCNNESIMPPGHLRGEDLMLQARQGIERIRKRHKVGAFIAYLQPYSNTNAPVGRLKEIYEPLLDLPGVVGLAVSTRPDCLDERKLDYLKGLAKKKYLWLELGLQTVNDETLARINRGHDYGRFLEAYDMARQRGIPVCVHLIIGLPGETRQMMLKTAMTVSELKVFGVKIHAFHVLKGAAAYTEYMAGKVKVMELAEYVQVAADFLELLDRGIVIHRLTGEGPRELTVAPDWIFNKMAVIDAIKKELAKRGTRQGHRAPSWC